MFIAWPVFDCLHGFPSLSIDMKAVFANYIDPTSFQGDDLLQQSLMHWPSHADAAVSFVMINACRLPPLSL